MERSKNISGGSQLGAEVNESRMGAGELPTGGQSCQMKLSQALEFAKIYTHTMQTMESPLSKKCYAIEMTWF